MKKQLVLIHGLGRGAYAMGSMALLLKRQGYQVTNIGYPSRKYPIATLVKRFIAPVFDGLPDATQIDVVTHSLGGILFRYYLAHHSDPERSRRIRRVVMLAPPNHGSEVADHIKHWSVARWLLGPAMTELGSGPDSIPNLLLEMEQQRFPCEIGVIAGTRSYEPWFSRWISEGNDGKVSITSTQLPGMKDFIQVNAGHTFIMEDKAVRQQILRFLGDGTFSH